MTNRRIVLRKIETLRQHHKRLRDRLARRGRSPDAEGDLDDAIAMSLVVCVQEVIDIASHIATDDGFSTPESAAAAILSLASHRILPNETASTLATMVALRNRIAHGYSAVDAERIVAELPAGLEALDRFVVSILAYIPDSEV